MTVGYDRAGDPREIFIASGKSGSALRLLMEDASVLASLLLQHGYSPAELRQRLGGDNSAIGAALAVAEGA
ncbi:MAG: hypothetical protein KIT81_06940 [Alphaproteobacteria bacterium]|nr:hypothetical protein [Alphaproteobacteria bacterium]